VKHERDGRGSQGEPTPSQAGGPEQKQTPQQRGEGIRGVPPLPGEPAKSQQEGAVNNAPLSPLEEKKRKRRAWREANRERIRAYQRRYYHNENIQPNEKLRQYQWHRAQERMEKERESQNDPTEQSVDLFDLTQMEQKQSQDI
jgi:hypothetical protein